MQSIFDHVSLVMLHATTTVKFKDKIVDEQSTMSNDNDNARSTTHIIK